MLMKEPEVGIIMGSDSDLPVMKEATQALSDLGISSEMTIVSAHRTPERMTAYAQQAKERGIKVIIAGAGGAAHLPGMVASMTTLPVIGVPVKSKALNGWDSLLSIVQMPAGIPVATVAINGAGNAGLLAAQMLAITNVEIDKKLEIFRERQKDQVIKKAEALEKMGIDAFLEGR